jgi:hypothetical protein
VLKFGMLLLRDNPNQRENLTPGKFCFVGSKMGDGKFKILQCTGTDGQDEKHSLQRTIVIMKKARATKGYVC